jgi:hypothetical protein
VDEAAALLVGHCEQARELGIYLRVLAGHAQEGYETVDVRDRLCHGFVTGKHQPFWSPDTDYARMPAHRPKA